MLYDLQPAKSMRVHLNKCSDRLEELNEECTELKSKFENTKHQLRSTKSTLRDVTSRNIVLSQRLKSAREKISQLKCKNASLKEECINLQVDLLSEATDSTDSDADDSAIEPTLQSIIGSTHYHISSLLNVEVPHKNH